MLEVLDERLFAVRDPGVVLRRGSSCPAGAPACSSCLIGKIASYRWAVTEADRIHWDGRYAGIGPAPADVAAPPLFAAYEHLFPTEGQALELACGRGRSSVWLARRGLEVWGVDVSEVAIGLAMAMAEQSGVGDSCRFEVVDLDGGLPDGPPVDVILCYFFRDARLDQQMVERLTPGGLLAVAALSTVDAGPGAFRVGPGELPAAFASLDVLAHSEGGGQAWLLARA
jgi:SAM-dependent methyltransferase